MGKNVIIVILIIACIRLYQTYVTPAEKEYDVEENYNRGLEFVKQGDFQKAKEEFEIIVKMDPYYTSVEHLLIIIDDAIALTINKETTTHLYSGIFHLRNKEHDQAINEFSKAIVINPKYFISYYTRGIVYYNLSQYDQAISDYTRAIEINPKDSVAYYNRGVSYSSSGQHDEAISNYNKSLEINPNNAKAYYNRGFSYSNIGLHEQAIIEFSKALELNPGYTNAYNYRGISYFKHSRDKIKGCADFERACVLGNCEYYNSEKSKGNCS